MHLLSFSEKEKLGKPKEEIGNLKMDLNIVGRVGMNEFI
jgi:hypothetical protein